MRILLDTNVVVDVLQQREPWHKDGEKIFLAAAMKQLTACITAKQVADIHYLTKRTFKDQAHTDDLAKQVVLKLLSFIELMDVCATDCQTAISINNNDFEVTKEIEIWPTGIPRDANLKALIISDNTGYNTDGATIRAKNGVIILTLSRRSGTVLRYNSFEPVSDDEFWADNYFDFG